MTRRGFLALLAVPVAWSQDSARPAIVGVLRLQPGDGRLFTVGERWTLIADPEVEDEALAKVLDLQNTLVSVTQVRDYTRAV